MSVEVGDSTYRFYEVVHVDSKDQLPKLIDKQSLALELKWNRLIHHTKVQRFIFEQPLSTNDLRLNNLNVCLLQRQLNNNNNNYNNNNIFISQEEANMRLLLRCFIGQREVFNWTT